MLRAGEVGLEKPMAGGREAGIRGSLEGSEHVETKSELSGLKKLYILFQ